MARRRRPGCDDTQGPTLTEVRPNGRIVRLLHRSFPLNFKRKGESQLPVTVEQTAGQTLLRAPVLHMQQKFRSKLIATN